MHRCSRPTSRERHIPTQIATKVRRLWRARPIRQRSVTIIVLVLLAGMAKLSLANPQPEQKSGEPLKKLSLAQLGDVEVTTASKEPEAVWKTPAAVYVLTNEDIRRSGA